ncbi:MAG: glycosyltransferase [Parvibaculum sp.]|nr:glycosyltransferase [Parvibaculum sp.]
MRILYVINGFDPGGAEHGLLTLIQAGFFRGHELKVLGFCYGRGNLAERISEAVGAQNLIIAKDDQDLSLMGVLQGAGALRRLLRKWRPTTVVLSLKQANVVGRFLLRMYPSVHCISFEHISRYRARRAEAVYAWLLRVLSGRVDEIWSDCQETLDATRRFFTPRERLENVVPLFRVTPDGVEKVIYKLSDRIEVSAAGRLVGRKNFDVIIEAVRELNASGCPAHLTIYGDGPDLEKLRALVSACALEDQVSLPGYNPKWAEEAAQSDIFVNASDTEGFCIVVAEAMAAGLPVIATDVGGIREYGQQNTNMVKFECGNVQELREAIHMLSADELLRERLGRKAKLGMEARFSDASIANVGIRILGLRS